MESSHAKVSEIKTGPEPLKTDKHQAILVLRLGAALNSIRAARHWADSIGTADDLAAVRNRFQAYLIAAAYLGEACSLLWKNQPCIARLARKGGATEEQLDDLKAISNPGTGLRKTHLKWIRDKETFHWDSAAFKPWVSASRHDVTWIREEADARMEVASYDALVKFTAKLGAQQGDSDDEAVRAQVRDVLAAMELVLSVFESAVCGFLRQHGASCRNGQLL